MVGDVYDVRDKCYERQVLLLAGGDGGGTGLGFGVGSGIAGFGG